MKLKSLARGQAQRWRGDLAREFVQHEPLLRCRFSAGQSHPKHERKRLFFARLLKRIPLITVILKVQPMEFGKLAIFL